MEYETGYQHNMDVQAEEGGFEFSEKSIRAGFIRYFFLSLIYYIIKNVALLMTVDFIISLVSKITH